MTTALITTLISTAATFAIVSLADTTLRGIRRYRELKGIN